MATKSTNDVLGWHFWRSDGGVWHGTRDDRMSDEELLDDAMIRTVHGATEDRVKQLAAEQNDLRAERGYIGNGTNSA